MAKVGNNNSQYQLVYRQGVAFCAGVGVSIDSLRMADFWTIRPTIGHKPKKYVLTAFGCGGKDVD